MNKKILVVVSSLVVLLAASQALAALVPYEYNGHYYYIVDGNNPNLNSGDRVCASIGQTCVGYTAKTTDICTFIHPSASVNNTSINGNSNGFYCNGAPQGYAACSAATNNCQICPACGTISCSDQIGDQYAQMYVECSGTPTTEAIKVTSPTPTPAPTATTTSTNSGNWLTAFLNWLHSVWLSWGWITPSGAPTGTNHATPVAQGSLLPAQKCDNGGQCKSGNCVRDDQGVFRCSCSPLGSDYSSCH